jgi:hypothetical protein
VQALGVAIRYGIRSPTNFTLLFSDMNPADALALRAPSPVYRRFLSALSSIQPLRIITTNVDQLLEKNLEAAAAINHTDMERVSSQFDLKSSFICKLHGDISSIESVVFTSEDYKGLLKSTSFRTHLARLLARASLVFIGYGLRDQYLIDLLAENHELARLFGDGPHFAILPDRTSRLPPSVRVVQYRASPHTDHRASITIVEEIRSAATRVEPVEVVSSPAMRSAHLLMDLLAEGTWQSSQTCTISDGSGLVRELIVGTGFTNEELPGFAATALHDIVVALMCFDTVVVSIRVVCKLHELLGPDLFWHLVRSGFIEFVNWTHEQVILTVFSSQPSSKTLNSPVDRHELRHSG